MANDLSDEEYARLMALPAPQVEPALALIGPILVAWPPGQRGRTPFGVEVTFVADDLGVRPVTVALTSVLLDGEGNPRPRRGSTYPNIDTRAWREVRIQDVIEMARELALGRNRTGQRLGELWGAPEMVEAFQALEPPLRGDSDAFYDWVARVYLACTDRQPVKAVLDAWNQAHPEAQKSRSTARDWVVKARTLRKIPAATSRRP